jgi:hypothetical protein
MEDIKEVFKVIAGNENYSISNFGNVMNNKNNKLLKLFNDIHGYRRALLGSKERRVDILVANAFLDERNGNILNHIDSNVENSHATNLRWINKEQNKYCRPIQFNNTSGIKGITFNKRNNRWIAQIGENNKMIYIGSYTNKEEAIEALKCKTKELIDKYAYKPERIVNLNIELPPNTNLNINIKVKEDEELKQLEEEFIKLIK